MTIADSPRHIRRIVVAAVTLATGFLMSLAGPTLSEFAPYAIHPGVVYIAMFFMGLAVVWTWSSIGSLLAGFLLSSASAMGVYGLVNGWALAAIGLSAEIISAQIILHLFGYATFMVLMGGAGILVGGYFFRSG